VSLQTSTLPRLPIQLTAIINLIRINDVQGAVFCSCIGNDAQLSVLILVGYAGSEHSSVLFISLCTSLH